VGWMTEVQFLAGAGFFFLHYYTQTSSGSHPSSYPCVPEVLSVGVKWLRHEADHFPPSRAKVKIVMGYTSTPLA